MYVEIDDPSDSWCLQRTLDMIGAWARVARFLAAKYGILLYIRDVRQGQYLRLLLYYALTRSLQLSHSTTL